MMYTDGCGKIDMDVAGKLQIKPGATVLVGNAPEGFALDLAEPVRRAGPGEQAGVVLV